MPAVTVHVPVLLDEVIHGLQLRPGAIIVDGTTGGAGHSAPIIERIGPGGTLISLDRDPDAIAEVQDRLQKFGEQNEVTVHCIARNYADLPEIIDELEIDEVHGILVDLGLSSDQLADRNRGFSFNSDGTLDLRFNRNAGEPAFRLVNRLGEKHLADIIYEYGEEKFSRRVARNICEHRHRHKIETAAQLSEIVRRSVPRSKNHSIDPATRTFQALRIAVNEELKWLKIALRRFPSVLAHEGCIAAISFHSLEDRIVKQSFNESSELEVVTRKPIRPSEQEVLRNPRSRSAKLRVARLRADRPH